MQTVGTFIQSGYGARENKLSFQVSVFEWIGFQVYVPLIQCQFREPMLSDTEQETLNRANGDELSGSTFSFTRPSDFRRLSLAIERNLNKQSGTQIFKKRKPQFAPDSQHPTKKLLLAGTNRLMGVVDWWVLNPTLRAEILSSTAQLINFEVRNIQEQFIGVLNANGFTVPEAVLTYVELKRKYKENKARNIKC